MAFLPSTAYAAPLDGDHSDILFQIKPQRKYSRCNPPVLESLPEPDVYLSGEDEDDLPTPRANQDSAVPIVQSLNSPVYLNKWRSSSLSATTDIEDDISEAPSDDDSEIVPFKVSDSIRKLIKPSRKQESRLSLVIPSPGMWPTIQKLQKATETGEPLPLPPQTPLSPMALARLAASNNLRIPTKSNTPSLADSTTSDGVSSLSCPSTPDLRSKDDDDDDDDGNIEWDLPVQLHPDAMETLKQIWLEVTPAQETQSFDHLIVPQTPCTEPTPQMAERGLNISITIPQAPAVVTEDEFSALSIPSPGGFFASLDKGSSSMWGFLKPKSEPSTSTAESFYGVPWRKPAPLVLEQVAEEDDEELYEGPPTARKIPEEILASSESSRGDPIVPEDYDQEYERKLHESATANMSRTSVWLATQEAYLAALNGEVVEEEPKAEDLTSQSQTPDASPLASDSVTASPSKKSVRFAAVEAAKSPTATINSIQTVTSDSLFYHAFQHACKKTSGQDAFTNRKARADALRAQRHYLPEAHRARLSNTFALVEKPVKKASAPWQVGPSDEEAEKNRELLANVNKEQQALQQLSVSSFCLDADRFLNQGSLLPPPAAALVKKASQSPTNKPRILDLGGEPTASWGWAVAVEYREAKVYTAVAASQGLNVGWTAHRGPSNHRTVTVPNTWTLPFPSNSFDVVSARSLHAILRNTAPTRDGGDEYDATLAEIRRVLAPGGYVHFSVMDAEVTAPPNSSIAARSIEFAVSLRTRGYDSCAGRRFVSKLDKAGFGDVKRSWMSLPIGGAEPDGMAAVTGLFGSLAWEKWILKLQIENGRPEDKLLDGIAKALDEAKNSEEGASWRMLVGFAQKP